MLRLDAARGLLGYTKQSITDIAERLGYARLPEFSREFANVMGFPRQNSANACNYNQRIH